MFIMFKLTKIQQDMIMLFLLLQFPPICIDFSIHELFHKKYSALFFLLSKNSNTNFNCWHFRIKYGSKTLKIL